MEETAPTPLKSAKTRPAAKGGYLKGEETRRRILDTGLGAFGEAALKTVTTRHIASAADVSLPTRQY
jgi:TetR/AcrR family transcriptional regulator, regulator of cefoperazone and chloramphenicol sensitivity